MEINYLKNGFSVVEDGKVIFTHTEEAPAIFVGKGRKNGYLSW